MRYANTLLPYGRRIFYNSFDMRSNGRTSTPEYFHTKAYALRIDVNIRQNMFLCILFQVSISSTLTCKPR